MAPRTRESIYPPTQSILVSAGDDDVTYDPPLRAISVGTAGDVAVRMAGDPLTTVVLPANALAVGVQHVGFFTQIRATSTTASGIVGWR